MNETLNTIYTRRAIRKFKPKAVTKRMIEKIIDAGRMAPSAINTQPWKFYVVTNKKTIQTLSEAIKGGAVKGIFKLGLKQIVKTALSALHFPHGADFLKDEDMVFHGAPVVIFITAPKDYEWAGLDIGMCAQNMMLAAKSLGLDTCPIGMAKYLEQTKAYLLLETDDSEALMLALILGYGDESPEVHTRKVDNTIFVV